MSESRQPILGKLTLPEVVELSILDRPSQKGVTEIIDLDIDRNLVK